MNKKVFAVFAAVAIMASSAVARMDGWYAGLNGGFGIATDAKGTFNDGTTDFALKSKMNSGAGFGASIGHSFDQWRFELELAYRRNEIKSVYVDGVLDDTYVSKSSKLTSVYVMGNAFYDIPVMDQVDWTVGAGLGVASARLNKLDKKVFAYQFITGPSYNWDAWTFGMQYRFVGHSRIKDTRDDKRASIKTPYIHAFELAVRYQF